MVLFRYPVVKDGLGLVLSFILLNSSCSSRQNTANDAKLEARIGVLEQTVANLKPGLGEIMGVIQQHHAKLYYSGLAENWPLAEYQLGEIREGFEDVLRYYPTFKDVKTPLTTLVPSLVVPGLNAVGTAVKRRNRSEFVRAFDTLSRSCTSCHQAANRPFIVIQDPSRGMFSNQKFRP